MEIPNCIIIKSQIITTIKAYRAVGRINVLYLDTNKSLSVLDYFNLFETQL